MNDHAIKNYHSGKSPLVTKIKGFLFVCLCFGTFAGILATTMEVGHVMQMERIAAASSQGE